MAVKHKKTAAHSNKVKKAAKPSSEIADPVNRFSYPKKRLMPQTIQKFLVCFAEHGVISHACKQAGVSPATIRNMRLNDPEFAAVFEESLDSAIDSMELEARTRAVDGWIEPVFGNLGAGMGTGKVGEIRKKSDNLLMFLLKGARPGKYGNGDPRKILNSKQPIADLLLAAGKGELPEDV